MNNFFPVQTNEPYLSPILQISLILLIFKNSSRVNTLIAEYEYPWHNRKNLPLPIQMQLSKKPKTFCCFFIAILEFTLKFEHFEKKFNIIAKYFGNHRLQKACLPKRIKGPVSENPLAVNVLNI